MKMCLEEVQKVYPRQPDKTLQKPKIIGEAQAKTQLT